jgi:hypothetical protein
VRDARPGLRRARRHRPAKRAWLRDSKFDMYSVPSAGLPD